MAPFDVGLLANDLEEMARELSNDTHLAQLVAGSAVGVSGVLTVGYVIWTIRGGWLLTSLLAQMPAWRMVDPLVVLNYLDEESAKSAETSDDDEDDSLETLLEKSESDHQSSRQDSKETEEAIPIQS